MFFNSCRGLSLVAALPGSFALSLLSEVETVLRRDYTAMVRMIFGLVSADPVSSRANTTPRPTVREDNKTGGLDRLDVA